MTAAQISLLSLVAGALAGLLATLVASAVRQRQDVTLRLLDRFLEARREVVDSVCDLSHFHGPAQLSPLDRTSCRDAIARLYYRHYDFLPPAVLDSLLLLQVALDRFDGRLYGIRERAVLPISGSAVASFVARCCRLRNARVYAFWVFGSASEHARAHLAVALHARDVLNELNRVASPGRLLGVPVRLRKVRSGR
ncbi:hypothetical protein PLCT1_00948 [Planctomycetaceae bacterium]|nr:hypothetical protein PLCT1_00948 [Planctomycetaceae bacterium]